MSRRGFTFIELMIVVFVIGILAAVGISKYQSFVVESRQKGCMSQQKALDQAYAVWETKNSPVPTDDGAYQFIDPLNGGPLSPTDVDSAYRWRWNANTDVFETPTDATNPETKSVLPQGSALSRLVADEKIFCCPELNKRSGGSEFVPRPVDILAFGAGVNGVPVGTPNANAIVSYQFYKAPTDVTASASNLAGVGWDTANPSGMVAVWVPAKIRRAIVCRGYGMDNGTLVASGSVGPAYTATTKGTPIEDIPFFPGAGPDGSREMLHQAFILQ